MEMELLENELHLWLFPFDDQSGTDCLKLDIDRVLQEEERKRFNRFKVQQPKVEFLLSRMLLRFLLGIYTDFDTTAVHIIADDMGRPFFHHRANRLPLYFSLSHTRNFICCLLSRKEKAGCDIERNRPRKYQGKLDRHVFSDDETAFSLGLHPEEQEHFFFFTWTLKEAFIKAEGKGLRIPLNSLSFSHKMWQKKTSLLAPRPQEPDVLWQFHSFSPGQPYLAGVACRHTGANLSFFSAHMLEGQILAAL